MVRWRGACYAARTSWETSATRFRDYCVRSGSTAAWWAADGIASSDGSPSIALRVGPNQCGDVVLSNIAGCQTLSRRSSTDQAPHSTMELGTRPKPGNAIGHEWLCVPACTPSLAE